MQDDDLNQFMVTLRGQINQVKQQRELSSQMILGLFENQAQILEEIISNTFRDKANSVDRIEFSQIIQNKANQLDFQRLIHELKTARNFEEFQKNDKVNNLVNESMYGAMSFAGEGPIDYDLSPSKRSTNIDARNLAVDLQDSKAATNTERMLVQQIEKVNQQYSESDGRDVEQNIIYTSKGIQIPTINQSSAPKLVKSSDNIHIVEDYGGDKAVLTGSKSKKNPSTARQALNDPIVLSKLSEKSENLLTTIRESKNIQHADFQNQIKQVQDDSLKLVQQLNEKVDEIFHSLCQCIESYDSNLNVKVDNVDSRIQNELQQEKTSFEQFKKELDEKLELKANKNSVANAFHKKANKTDVNERAEEINKIIEEMSKKLALDSAEVQKKCVEMESQLKKNQQEQNDKIIRAESGIKQAVYLGLPEEFTKYLQNFALKSFGSSILEDKPKSDKDDLQYLTEKIFQHHFKKLRIDQGNLKTTLIKDIQTEISDSLNTDIEDLQMQINSMRKEVKEGNKRWRERMMKTQEFSFDQEQLGETINSSELKAEVKTIQIDIENIMMALQKKANVKDVCTLIDQKANSKDVMKIFAEVKKGVEILNSKYVSLENTKTFTDMLCEQKMMNKSYELNLETAPNMSQTTGVGTAAASQSMLNLSHLLQNQTQVGSNNSAAVFLWYGQTTPFTEAPAVTSFNQSALTIGELAPKDPQLFLKWTQTPQQSQHLSCDHQFLEFKEGGLYSIQIVFFTKEFDKKSQPQVQMYLDNQLCLRTIAEGTQYIIYHNKQFRHVSMQVYLNVHTGQKLAFQLINQKGNCITLQEGQMVDPRGVFVARKVY